MRSVKPSQAVRRAGSTTNSRTPSPSESTTVSIWAAPGSEEDFSPGAGAPSFVASSALKLSALIPR